MAEVTGPLSSLPGACHAVPKGTVCDDHPGRPASHRVQGETDSFGSELHDLCLECYEKHKVANAAYRAEIACGTCDWCGNGATDLCQRRDSEEGMAGRLYMVCGACVTKEMERLVEEAKARGDDRWDEWADCASDYDPIETCQDDLDDDEDDQDFTDPVEVEVSGNEVPQGAKAYVDGRFIY